MKRHFTLNDANVGQHINVYNERDIIQRGGTVRAGVDFEGIIPSPWLEVSDDPRYYRGATNVSVTPPDIPVSPPGVRVSPRYHFDRIIYEHKFMHASIRVWNTYIRPRIILPPPNNSTVNKDN